MKRQQWLHKTGFDEITCGIKILFDKKRRFDFKNEILKKIDN